MFTHTRYVPKYNIFIIVGDLNGHLGKNHINLYAYHKLRSENSENENTSKM